jgi:putative inorganic carbon (hco3(-)) transporter
MLNHNSTSRVNRALSSTSSINGETFLQQKMRNWIGYLFILVLAIVYGYLIAKQTLVGFAVFAGIVGLFVAVVCLLNSEVALYVNVFYSFFSYYFFRLLHMDDFPIGVVTDLLVITTLLSLFTKPLKLKTDFKVFMRHTVIIWLTVVVFYHILELFNPNASSVAGWFQVFRRLIIAVFFLFITYSVLDTYRKIRRFVAFLFACCLIMGVYGCIQQWHGLFNFEKQWVISNPVYMNLMYIYGDFRKFSTLSDPAAFGMEMAAVAVFFIIIGLGQKRKRNLLLYIGGSIPMLLGMSYSGTRTATLMTIGGLAFFILLTIDKRSSRLFAVTGILALLFLLYAPIYNSATLIRFRTSFSGKKDESYLVREKNRARIQPYIYSHPIGGGLYTTGGSGEKYNPGHYLAGFPPDSGYLRKALETGWIGLLLITTFYFVVMRYGIRGYFQTKKQRFKTLYAACLSLVLAFYIGEFAQEAIGQIADMVIYYPAIAIMLRLREFEQMRETSHENLV